MKMRRLGQLLTILLLSGFVFINESKAQFETPDTRSLAQLKSKTLIVTLQDEATNLLLRYKNQPDKLNPYKEGIAKFNEMFKSTAEKYYTYGKNIETKGEKEVTQLILDGNMRYAVLKFDLRQGKPDPMTFGEIYGKGPYTDEIRKRSKDLGYGVISINLIDRSKKLMPVFEVSLPVAYPSEADMVYAIKLIDNELNKLRNERGYEINEFQTEVEQNNKILKNRTLLIDKAQLSEKTDAEDIQKHYPYKFEITDYATISKAITEGDTNYAYVQIVPLGVSASAMGTGKIKTRILHLVIDAGDGKVLGKDKPTRMNYQQIANDISRKEIKGYVIDK